MPRSYWIAAIAIGLALVASEKNAVAQEVPANNVDEHSRDSEEPEQPEINRLPDPLRVEIVVEDGEAQAARAHQEEAENREIRDIAAQEGMNEATRRMADLAFWQTILVAIGTVVLIYTLYLTRQANLAARQAVEVTRDIGEAQARGYLTAESAQFTSNADYAACQIEITNTGLSPANVTHILATLTVYGMDQNKQPSMRVSYKLPQEDANPRLTVAGQSDANTAIFWYIGEHTELGDALNLIRGGKSFFIDYLMTYRDVFGKTSKTTFRVTTLNDDSVYSSFEAQADHRASVSVRTQNYERPQSDS